MFNKIITLLEFQWYQRCHLILVVLLVKFSQKLQNCFPTHRRKHLSNVVNAVILTERKSELWVSSFQMCYRQTEFPTLLTLCFNYVFGYWQMEIMLQFILILKLCYWQTEIVLPTYKLREAFKKNKQDISWHHAKFIYHLPTLPNYDIIYYDIFGIFWLPTHLKVIMTYNKLNLVPML